MNQKHLSNETRRTEYREERNFNIDLSSLMKYVVLTAVFYFIIYWVNNIVMKAIHISPTRMVGNGIISLHEIHNKGAAFNLFQGEASLLITIAVIAIVIMIVFSFVKSTTLSHNAISSMSLLSSGILINMVERIQHGFVIDYIHLDFLPAMPMFNMADIFIVCGILGILPALIVKRG